MDDEQACHCPCADKNEVHHAPSDPGASLLAKLESKKYSRKLSITTFLVLVTINLLIFREVKYLRRLSHKVPESILLTILGVAVGGLMTAATADVKILLEEANASIFFDYLLPPIILEAAYQLYCVRFIYNLYGILKFAIVGTTLNIFGIGLCLYGTYVKLMDNGEFSLLHMLLLSTMVSAVDPVAVLTVFDQLGVQRSLYILIFGESLLNDGVTVVIFDTLEKIAFTDVKDSTYGYAVLAFIPVAFGGSFVGVVYGMLSSLACKYTSRASGAILQPMFVILTAYMSFLNAQLFHWSGILALISCGLTQRRYAFHNLYEESRVTIEHGVGIMATISETIIFLIMGLKVFDPNVLAVWDWNLCLLTFLFCLICRFAITFCLGTVINRNRLHKLTKKHMIMVWYGGLRGAVSFAMAASLQEEKVSGIFAGATLFVVLSTVIVMGATIQPLVRYFQFLETPSLANFTSTVIGKVKFHALAGMGSVIGGGGGTIHYYLEMFQRWDKKYVQSFICKQGTKEKQFKALYKEIAQHGCNVHDEPQMDCRDCVSRINVRQLEQALLPWSRGEKLKEVSKLQESLNTLSDYVLTTVTSTQEERKRTKESTTSSSSSTSTS